AIAMSTALALGFSWTPLRLIRPFEIRWHLAAEETFYQVRSLAPLRIANGHFDAGVRLHEALTRRGIRPKIVGGAIGMLGYFSDLPLFDVMGLTSKVGRKAIAMRDRPGHEKRATVEEILEAGVLVDLWPLHGPRWRDATRVELDGVRFHLVRFDPELVEALAAVPGARLPDPLRDVDALLRGATRSELLEAVRFYSVFLADWPRRDEVLGPLRARLAAVPGARLPGPLRDVDALLRGATRSELLEAVRFYSVFLADWPRRDEVLGPLRARLAAVEDFEEEHDLPPPFRVVRWRFPEGKSGLGHSSTLGMEGRGELRIPLQIVARELRLVLGGPASDRLGVKLLVDGEVRTAVHPAGGPGLDPVVVDTAAWIGRPGELRIFDLDPRAEVGVEVDAIHFAPAGADLADRLDAGEPLGPLLWEAERSLPAGHPVRARIEARVAERHRFDDGLPAGTTVEGEAFGEGPAPGALPWQA